MKNSKSRNGPTKTILGTAVMAILVLALQGGHVWASPTVIIDTTPGGAVIDGTVSFGEYVGSSTGINSGMGGQLSTGPVSIDSDISGNIQMGFEFPYLKDFVIVYFDVVPGGTSTTGFLFDDTSPWAAAASGVSLFAFAGGDLFFAPGFEADYAMAFDFSQAELYSLGGPTLGVPGLVHVGSPPLVSSGSFDALEINIPAGMMGLTPGDSINYVVTLGSPFQPDGFFRSDEFHGVSPTTVPPGNPGLAAVFLAPEDYNTFQTFAGSIATIGASYTCTPNSGTMPFATTMTVSVDNLNIGQTRHMAGQINLTLASGGSYSNWRAGSTDVGPGGTYSSTWSQSIPALGTLIGVNTFELVAEDVTPAPFNQPPYPAAGDTATAACTVTGVAP